MKDRVELLELALKCRLLAVQMEDEAAARALDRLADDYDIQVNVVDYLARRRSPPGASAPHLRAKGQVRSGSATLRPIPAASQALPSARH